MSDALNDFFAQNAKKKNKKKAPAPKAQPAAVEQTEEAPSTTATAAATAQPEPQPSPAQDYADSSDDESNIVVAKKEIIERKDLVAKKTKEEEKSDGAAGWGLGSKLGQAPEQSNEGSMPFSAPARGPQTGSKMSFGKPMFSRKQKGIMDQQDFPDLDAAGSSGKNGAPENRAAGPMMFGSGSTAKGPRDAAPTEEAKVMKKPVFTGKAKLNTGLVATEEGSGQRMNYDFSRMNMSAATTGKRAEGEQKPRGEGERRGPPRNAGQDDFEDDDEFEVVKEKKKTTQRRAFDGESSFGAGMPTFTRGGGNRGE